jgi:hypothetical protein
MAAYLIVPAPKKKQLKRLSIASMSWVTMLAESSWDKYTFIDDISVKLKMEWNLRSQRQNRTLELTAQW